VVVGALLAGGVTSGNRQPPESDVVHDHIRLRQHQIVRSPALRGEADGPRRCRHAQLGTDLAQASTLGVQVGGTLNVLADLAMSLTADPVCPGQGLQSPSDWIFPVATVRGLTR
jgi:hypothetical protein